MRGLKEAFLGPSRCCPSFRSLSISPVVKDLLGLEPGKTAGKTFRAQKVAAALTADMFRPCLPCAEIGAQRTEVEVLLTLIQERESAMLRKRTGAPCGSYLLLHSGQRQSPCLGFHQSPRCAFGSIGRLLSGLEGHCFLKTRLLVTLPKSKTRIYPFDNFGHVRN